MVRVLLRVVILGGAGKEISLIIDGEALEMALRAARRRTCCRSPSCVAP